jgi:dipeptidyl-peptidase-4
MRLLIKRPYIDPERVGVHGTSHGGFMTGRAMTEYPDVYKAGVANAGVHDWRYYTATYAERFMDLPLENKEGYDEGSSILKAKNLEGKFLIQHGMVDINVHVNNALALADALHKEGKDFELQIYPNNGHYIGGKGYERQWNFLKKHLLDPYDEKGNRK